MRSEWLAYLVPDAMSSSFEIISATITAVYYWFSRQINDEEVPLSEDGWTLLSAGRDKVAILWDLHDYSRKSTVPTYEMLEDVCVIHSKSPFASSLDSYKRQKGRKKKSESLAIYFITVGERGTVRIWNSEGAVCLFEQQSLDVTVNSDSDDSKRGFTAATILPLDQGLLCVTVDQQFLFYSTLTYSEEMLKLMLSKRLVDINV